MTFEETVAALRIIDKLHKGGFGFGWKDGEPTLAAPLGLDLRLIAEGYAEALHYPDALAALLRPKDEGMSAFDLFHQVTPASKVPERGDTLDKIASLAIDGRGEPNTRRVAMGKLKAAVLAQPEPKPELKPQPSRKASAAPAMRDIGEPGEEADAESWRSDWRISDKGNPVVSLIYATVTLFPAAATPSRWRWCVANESRSPRFSQWQGFATQEEARLDAWDCYRSVRKIWA